MYIIYDFSIKYHKLLISLKIIFTIGIYINIYIERENNLKR